MATEMQNVSDFGPLQSIVQRTVVQLLKEVSAQSTHVVEVKWMISNQNGTV